MIFLESGTYFDNYLVTETMIIPILIDIKTTKNTKTLSCFKSEKIFLNKFLESSGQSCKTVK